MTPSGIEPVTFRFVAQHLNHCYITVPCFYTTRKESDAASVTITHRSINVRYNIKYVYFPLAFKTLPIQSKEFRKLFSIQNKDLRGSETNEQV